MLSLCIVVLHVTVNNIKILSVTQKPLLWRIYVAGNNETYLDRHVKYPILLFDFENIWVSPKIYIKVPNIKFHENPSRRSRTNTYGQTDGMTNLKGAFHDYANVPKGGPKHGIVKFISNRR